MSKFLFILFCLLTLNTAAQNEKTYYPTKRELKKILTYRGESNNSGGHGTYSSRMAYMRRYCLTVWCAYNNDSAFYRKDTIVLRKDAYDNTWCNSIYWTIGKDSKKKWRWRTMWKKKINLALEEYNACDTTPSEKLLKNWMNKSLSGSTYKIKKSIGNPTLYLHHYQKDSGSEMYYVSSYHPTEGIDRMPTLTLVRMKMIYCRHPSTDVYYKDGVRVR